ncbi:hypothetical protein K504DRAFT_464869 [Pleomassaria siparia CBS 279.74]|uniref:Uncharacterized protein n=1 Tax=Pleomassaria siparia CBS 279.74 TaxID=1314801 RepID=A0A6G1KJU3_9PLEO|nr:hypothetical protein K504DRAFT_464869 [Pleomassaria siparia CBS 279.74]
MSAKEKEEAANLTDEERLMQAALSAQKALDAQSAAKSLKTTASSITDPKRREKLLKDAYQKETEAHGNSKKARMLQSGAFQGTMGGAGIGGAVAMGVGTLVGTVVGTVTAIPATGLGALAGAGVGVIHGPFIKLPKMGGGGGKEDEKKGEDGKDDDDLPKEVQEGEEITEEDDIVPDPTALREAADAVAEERAKQERAKQEREKEKRGARNGEKGKRKPRKIEVRSGNKEAKED